MSDLSAFTIYKHDAGMTAAIDLVTPLLGSGSLLLGPNGTAGRRINMVRTTTPNSFTSGRARFLLGTTVVGSLDAFGFVFQLSQADLTGASGQAYAYYVEQAACSSWQPKLAKITAGLATRTVLASGTTYTATTARAVEVQWLLDIPNLGGMQLTVKLGTALDYSDLVLDSALNILVSTSVLTTSVGEGPMLAASGSAGSYRYDHFEVVPLIVG